MNVSFSDINSMKNTRNTANPIQFIRVELGVLGSKPTRSGFMILATDFHFVLSGDFAYL